MASELQQLNKRKGMPYSRGHQIMYDAPIKLLSDSRHAILDIGFGIGYGLFNMIPMRIIKRYVGCEPDADSFDYVNNKRIDYKEMLEGDRTEINLFNLQFSDLAVRENEFDYTFCIEVIEHMEEGALHNLLMKVHGCTRDAFFMSTPDPDKSPEGEWTMTYLINTLRQFQFNPVVVTSQWTNLWICNPINK